MAMQPGKPIIGQDAVVFLDRISTPESGGAQKTVSFRWKNHDIFTEVDVYLVRNDKSKKLVDGTMSIGALPNSPVNAIYLVPEKILGGRFVAQPGKLYTVTYTFTWQEHYKDFRKKYPVFKFRIERVGNPSIFAESNEFKVVY